jgi:hypothetical protein
MVWAVRCREAVTRVRVVGADGEVFAERETTTSQGGAVIHAVTVPFTDGTAYVNLRDRALAGGLRLEVEATDPARVLAVPLPPAVAGRWTQGVCL